MATYGLYSSDAIAFAEALSPAQITADQTDYNPTGLSTATVLRLSSDASRTINSLDGGADGRILVIHNVGSQNIVLLDDDGSTGTASMRFALSANVTLAADQSLILQYDSTTSRWRLLSRGQATGVGGGDALTTNPLSQFASTTSLQLKGVISDETGSGALVFATSPTLVTPALGTPSSGVLTNCTGLPVAGGGTGRASHTAYSVICGGTTTTAAQQSVASVGSAGQPLVSLGAGALPTFQSMFHGSLISALEITTDESTTSTSLVELTTDDEVTFTLPAGTHRLFVIWYAETYNTVAAESHLARVEIDVDGDGDYAEAGTLFGAENGTTNSAANAALPLCAKYLSTNITGGGTVGVRITVRQDSSAGGRTAHFRNRQLMVFMFPGS